MRVLHMRIITIYNDNKSQLKPNDSDFDTPFIVATLWQIKANRVVTASSGKRHFPTTPRSSDVQWVLTRQSGQPNKTQ